MNISILKTSLLCIALLIQFLSKAQDENKGRLLIFIEPLAHTIIRLDTTLVRSSQTPMLLKPGTYIVKAWAPKKQLFIDTVKIVENKIIFVTTRLKTSEEYSTYKKDLISYKFKRIGTRIAPAILTIGYSAFSYLKYTNNEKLMADHLAKAQEAEKKFETAISLTNIANYKEEYETERAAYDKARTNNNKLAKTAAIGIPAAAIVSVGLFILSKKFVKPVYTEPPPLLSFKSIDLNTDYKTTCSVSVILNINH